MNYQLEQYNHIKIGSFITLEKADELAQEFFRLEQSGNVIRDAQSPNAISAANHLPFVKLLVEKIPQVSEICGEPVLPTYTYGRIYRNGDLLPRHRDRDACEISLTLNLYQDHDWPIFVQRPDGFEEAVNLRPSEAIMYLGCDADHWRERYEGDTFVQIFLHYVRANGPRASSFFDLESIRNNAIKSGDRQQPVQPIPFANPLLNIPQIPASYQADYSTMKVGRNELCPCGSARRFKHCHGQDAAALHARG